MCPIRPTLGCGGAHSCASECSLALVFFLYREARTAGGREGGIALPVIRGRSDRSNRTDWTDRSDRANRKEYRFHLSYPSYLPGRTFVRLGKLALAFHLTARRAQQDYQKEMDDCSLPSHSTKQRPRKLLAFVGVLYSGAGPEELLFAASVTRSGGLRSGQGGRLSRLGRNRRGCRPWQTR